MNPERTNPIRIGLIGKGKTGSVISKVASDGYQNHAFQIAQHFSSKRPLTGETDQKNTIDDIDVFIDFSVADQLLNHVNIASEFGKPLVIGTTGWEDKKDEVRSIAERNSIGIVYGANFSVGVNLFFQILQEASKRISKWKGYDPFLHEEHHRFKKDAPSGTAKVAHEILNSNYGDQKKIQVSSTRAGYIPGTHLVGFDSEVDQITIQHEARNREGFAKGALLAAQWIQEKKGYFEFHEIMDQVCSE